MQLTSVNSLPNAHKVTSLLHCGQVLSVRIFPLPYYSTDFHETWFWSSVMCCSNSCCQVQSDLVLIGPTLFQLYIKLAFSLNFSEVFRRKEHWHVALTVSVSTDLTIVQQLLFENSFRC
jgi:hypothetical protein